MSAIIPLPFSTRSAETSVASRPVSRPMCLTVTRSSGCRSANAHRLAVPVGGTVEADLRLRRNGDHQILAGLVALDFRQRELALRSIDRFYDAFVFVGAGNVDLGPLARFVPSRA